MVVPVRIVAIDDQNCPIGETFQVVTRDVANSSIGLIHFNEFKGDRFAIHMSLAQSDVFMVIALTWTGEMGPFYGAAGKYIEKLNRFPASI